jgi:hypothetical protein
MGMTEWFIKQKLMARGLTESEATAAAAQPWVQGLAADTSKIPPAMKAMGPAEVKDFRARAKDTGIPMHRMFQADFYGSTADKAGDPSKQVPLGKGAAAPPIPTRAPRSIAAAAPPGNPIALAAQQPPSAIGGLHAPKTSMAAMGPTDFGWLFNKPASGESGFHSAISRAEGTTDAKAQAAGFASGYDVPLGYGKYGTPSKPLTQMTLKEAYDFGNQIRKNPDNPHNSSALGKFQIVGSTLKDVMETAGLSWDDTFSAENQQKLANAIAERQGVKSTTWAGFGVHPKELAKARTAWKSGDNLPGGGPQLGTPDPSFNPAEGMFEGAGSVNGNFFTNPAEPYGLSASGSVGMAHMSPSAQANAVLATPPPVPTANPMRAAPPPTPSRNPMRGAPQISATGEVGAANGGLPSAPAYANAQFAPPMPTRNPLRGAGSMQAFGQTGMGNAFPSANGFAQLGPQASASVGAMNGGLPPAPAFGKASFGVPSALAHLVGRSPMPSAQTMSPMPSMAPRIQGFGMTNATGLTSPFAGGLGMNPMTAAIASMRAAPVMPGGLTGAGTTMPGATSFAGGFGSPAMPRAATMPMQGTAAARSRAMPTMPQPGAPQAPSAYGPGAAGMGAGVGPSLTIGGRSAGLNNGFAPGSWGNATNSMKLQDIGASYGRGAAALSQAINRGLQGFRANRSGNIAGRMASLNMLRNFGQSGQLLGGSQVTGYGYL